MVTLSILLFVFPGRLPLRAMVWRRFPNGAGRNVTERLLTAEEVAELLSVSARAQCCPYSHRKSIEPSTVDLAVAIVSFTARKSASFSPTPLAGRACFPAPLP
jgi:hypothetical protein